MMRIDLNADVVEGYDDRALLPFLTSVNIACGGHAGDEPTMAAIVRAAEALGLALGAHPSYPDRQHFGRREMAMEPTALGSALRAQVTALVEVAAAAGSRLVHVKPHGARYNTAARDLDTVRVVARAIAEVDPTLRLVGLGGSRLLEAGREVGLGVAGEAFATPQTVRWPPELSSARSFMMPAKRRTRRCVSSWTTKFSPSTAREWRCSPTRSASTATLTAQLRSPRWSGAVSSRPESSSFVFEGDRPG